MEKLKLMMTRSHPKFKSTDMSTMDETDEGLLLLKCPHYRDTKVSLYELQRNMKNPNMSKKAKSVYTFAGLYKSKRGEEKSPEKCKLSVTTFERGNDFHALNDIFSGGGQEQDHEAEQEDNLSYCECEEQSYFGHSLQAKQFGVASLNLKDGEDYARKPSDFCLPSRFNKSDESPMRKRRKKPLRYKKSGVLDSIRPQPSQKGISVRIQMAEKSAGIDKIFAEILNFQ